MKQHLKTVKYSSRKKRKVIWNVIFIVYLAVLLRITVFRSGFLIKHLWSGTVNLSLFQSYLPLIQDQNWMRIVYLFGGILFGLCPLACICKEAGGLQVLVRQLWQDWYFHLPLNFPSTCLAQGYPNWTI